MAYAQKASHLKVFYNSTSALAANQAKLLIRIVLGLMRTTNVVAACYLQSATLQLKHNLVPVQVT